MVAGPVDPLEVHGLPQWAWNNLNEALDTLGSKEEDAHLSPIMFSIRTRLIECDTKTQVQIGQSISHPTVSCSSPSGPAVPLPEERTKTPSLSLKDVLIVVACSLPFYLSIICPEWYIDELFAITRNEDARGETPILEILQHDFWGNHMWSEGHWTHKSYRPIVTISYWLQYWFNGYLIKPQPLRVFSCLLNTTTALLLALVLCRVYNVKGRIAAVCAGIFAAHPIHTENVVYLVGRADIFATAFWLIAVLVHFELTERRFSSFPSKATMPLFALIILLACLSGFSKEPGFTVLVFLALTQVLKRQGPSRWKLAACLLASFGVIFKFRSWLVGGTKVDFSYVDTPIPYQSDISTRTLSYLHVHAVYAQLILLPINQSWDYSYNAIPVIKSLEDYRVLGILACYTALLCLGNSAIRKVRESDDPRPLLSIAAVLFPFVPASNLFFVVGTVDAVNWPRSAKTLHQFATTLHRADHLEEARELYLASLSIFDDNALTDYCIAQIDIETNRFNEAHDRFLKILAGHGIGFGSFNRFLIMVDFGFTLTAMRKYHIPVLKEGLTLNEDVPHALNALGICYLQLGDIAKGVEAFRRGIHYDPENPWLWSNLAAALLIGEGADSAGEAQRCAAFAVEKSTEAMGFIHPKFTLNYELATAKVESMIDISDSQPQLEFFFHRLL
ncbi:transmembrane and tetratricopeptide repeat containing 1 [Perkinsus chesapeaki]|uniref:dolichyl-phosphate-mannose--protein mannosyltransferase n=1 Tax=Perkinsus chesapeaki TaxID=330153 RepID=A0A7J6MLP2_PERCH|nr:transmembrane and tetratricopeptide repeat containing 1 [Perkinsus chesapeaki]